MASDQSSIPPPQSLTTTNTPGSGPLTDNLDPHAHVGSIDQVSQQASSLPAPLTHDHHDHHLHHIDPPVSIDQAQQQQQQQQQEQQQQQHVEHLQRFGHLGSVVGQTQLQNTQFSPEVEDTGHGINGRALHSSVVSKKKKKFSQPRPFSSFSILIHICVFLFFFFL